MDRRDFAIAGSALALLATTGSSAQTRSSTVGREVYEAFQRGEFARWDAVIAADVELNSSGYWGGKGIQLLKDWGNAFITAFRPRIDLVDEHEALDAQGNGRSFIVVNLNWKHQAPFFGVQPTGREGTSVEIFYFVVRAGKVTRFNVADNTLDLTVYLWDRGYPMPHMIQPTPIVRGIERRA
jgi:ketosteroid isomerase-like protein